MLGLTYFKMQIFRSEWSSIKKKDIIPVKLNITRRFCLGLFSLMLIFYMERGEGKGRDIWPKPHFKSFQERKMSFRGLQDVKKSILEKLTSVFCPRPPPSLKVMVFLLFGDIGSH